MGILRGVEASLGTLFRVGWGGIVALSVLVAASLVSAQSASTDERARLHFQSGAAYYDAGEYENALREFQSAYELSQRPQLFYNMYLCEQAIGELEAAATHLERYLGEVAELEGRDTLQTRLESLRHRIAQRAAGQADPGGEPEDGRPIDAPHDDDPEADPGTETRAAPEGHVAPPPPREPGLNIPAIAAFGVSALGLVGAVVFGPLTLTEDSSLAGQSCAATRTCDTGTLQTYALLTDISFAVAAVGAIAGLVLALVYEPAPEGDSSASLRISPFASADGAGLALAGAL